MEQIHKRFSAEQVKLLMQRYSERHLARKEVEEILGIGKTRFFALLKAYRQAPESFSVAYERTSRSRLSVDIEQAIAQALGREKQLVKDKRLPISGYNYSAVRDRLRKKNIKVSVPTIITRAKRLDCYQPKRKHKTHEREVVTTAIGALIQHDASLHLWSPYASEKWTLITSIDDYSRMLLFADFVAEETSWAHIQAAQVLMQTYGLPLRYYVDNLRVFRFVQGRDSVWRKQVLETDDVAPQWRQVLALLKVEVTYALSPQAKGKVERPYRWLQDRIVRTCALERLATLEDVRTVLQDEVHRYNTQQVHSSTGQIPHLRFEQARTSGNSLFRPFALPKPYTSPKDVFCLRSTRIVDGYRKVSLFNQPIPVPHVPLREEVELHLLPDLVRQVLEVRIWWQHKMIHALHFPLRDLHLRF